MVNSIKEKKIIFCQAPADIPYALTLYEKYHLTNVISIYVINVKGMFDFLNDLQLNIDELVYIPYSLKSLKSIKEIIKEKKRINVLYKKHFRDINNLEVYFFSKYEDWLTAAFIVKLSKNKSNKVFYLGHYDNLGELYEPTSSISLKMIFYLFIQKYITNIWFKVKIKEILPEFPFSNYNIQEINLSLDKNVFVKHQYNFNSFKSEKKNVIIFISPCEPTIFDSLNYDRILIEIVELLKEVGFSVFVKGHPRLGLPESIKETANFVVPSYVSGEFIKNEMFSLCLGIDTTVIAHYAKHEILDTYSLIKFFPASNPKLHKIAIEYLKQQSNDKMKFCETINDLKIIASNIKNEI